MRQSLFDKIISLLALHPDQPYAILDVGCGNGDLLGAVGSQVGHASRLVGIDAKASSIAAAQEQRPAGEYLCQKFEHRLSFGDGEFDLVLCVDMLECVVDKAALLHEMARVLKPQGRVLCAHWDWETQVYATEQPQLMRHFVHAFADWQQGWMDAADGMMGRKLWGIFQQSKLFTGHVDVFTLVETRYEPGQYGYDRLQDLSHLVEQGALTRTDYESIRQEMEARAQQGAYFYSLNSYIYHGWRLT